MIVGEEQITAVNQSWSDDDYDYWMACIKDSEEERKPYASLWTDLRTKYAGRKFTRAADADVEIWNKHSVFVNTVIPQIINGVPECSITPLRPGETYRLEAEHRENRVNGFARQMRLHKTLEKCFRSACWGQGIIQTGIEIKSNLYRRIKSQDGVWTDVDVDFNRARKNEYCDAGYPYAAWVDPMRFYLDFSADDLEEGTWCALEYFLTREEAMADPRYAHIVNEVEFSYSNPPRTGEDIDTAKNRQSKAYKQRREYLRMFDIYVKTRWVDGADVPGAILTICDSAGGYRKLIQEIPLDYGIEGFPFIMFKPLPVEGYSYSIPLLCQMSDSAHALNVFANSVVDAAAQQKNIVSISADTADPERKAEEIRRARNNSTVVIQGEAKNTIVGQIPPASVEATQMLDRLTDQISGQADFQRGAPMGGRTTATEVQTIATYVGVRLADLVNRYGELCGETFRRIDAIADRYIDSLHGTSLSVDEYRYVTIDADQPLTGEVTDYLYDVQSGTTEKIDPVVRQKRTETLISRVPEFNQSLFGEGMQMRLSPLLDDYMRQSLGIRNVRRILQPMPQQPPPPMQGQMPPEMAGSPGAGNGADGSATPPLPPAPPPYEPQDDARTALVESKVSEEMNRMAGGQYVPVLPTDLHEAEMQTHLAILQDMAVNGEVNEQSEIVDLVLQHIRNHQEAMQWPAPQQVMPWQGPPAIQRRRTTGRTKGVEPDIQRSIYQESRQDFRKGM